MSDLYLIPVIIFSYIGFSIAQKLIDVFNNRYNQKLERDWLKYGFLSKKDLHHLDPFEFEKWCGDFLDRLGYSNIQITEEQNDGGKDIICELIGEKIYVECKRYSFEEDAHFRVTRDIAQKLVGAMVGDGIHKGIIITTGIITERAYEYVKKLPPEYHIELIDGDMLVKKYRELRYKEINIDLSAQRA